jgi:uncharacterized membrane protein
MKNLMKNEKFKYALKELILFVIGGAAYVCIELLYRGYSDISMFFVGGLCFVIVGLLNEKYPWEMPLISQQFISAIAVTIIEFISGVILNLVLKLDVWDYSHTPYNLLGQICLLFTVLWFFLSLLGIFVDDFIRWKLFGEEKPHYGVFIAHIPDDDCGEQVIQEYINKHIKLK